MRMNVPFFQSQSQIRDHIQGSTFVTRNKQVNKSQQKSLKMKLGEMLSNTKYKNFIDNLNKRL